MATSSNINPADFFLGGLSEFANETIQVSINPHQKYSFDEYIDFCLKYPLKKFELVNGQIILMAGGTDRHFHLISNCNTELAIFLKNSQLKCKCYPGLAVKISEDTYRIPDILVACGDNPNPNYAQNPVIIGEVLSPSTQKLDQTGKLDEYKALGSVQEIIIISKKVKSVEVYRRKKRFGWSKDIYTTGSINFESIGCTVSIDDIYYDVDI